MVLYTITDVFINFHAFIHRVTIFYLWDSTITLHSIVTMIQRNKPLIDLRETFCEASVRSSVGKRGLSLLSDLSKRRQFYYIVGIRRQ